MESPRPDTDLNTVSGFLYERRTKSGSHKPTSRSSTLRRSIPGPLLRRSSPFKLLPAENYHQDYLKNNLSNPYIVNNDLPKLENLRKLFPALYRPKHREFLQQILGRSGSPKG